MGKKITSAVRCAVLICTALVLASCATKFAYDRLDWAISWKVKRLVNLDGEQKQRTSDAIHSFHAWHRQTQLPQYAAYLTAVHERVKQGDISAADVAAEIEQIQSLIDQSVAYILPDAAEVLSRLTQDHTDELLNSLTEERDEYIEEKIEVTRSERLEQRYETFEKHFKRWLGSPTRQQKQQIQQWALSLEPYEALTAKQQLAWQQQLDELLAKREHKDALLQGLKALVIHRTDNWDPKLAHIVGNNQQRTYLLIADLLNNLTPKQRQHLAKETHDYAKIFNELHNQGR